MGDEVDRILTQGDLAERVTRLEHDLETMQIAIGLLGVCLFLIARELIALPESKT
jgi:hypothetical protein